jgi:hypothetical protein
VHRRVHLRGTPATSRVFRPTSCLRDDLVSKVVTIRTPPTQAKHNQAMPSLWLRRSETNLIPARRSGESGMEMVCRVRRKAVLQESRETSHKTPCLWKRDERIVLKRSLAKGRPSHLTTISKSKLRLQCSAFSPPLSITSMCLPMRSPHHSTWANWQALRQPSEEGRRIIFFVALSSFRSHFVPLLLALLLRGWMTIEKLTRLVRSRKSAATVRS